MGPGLAGDRGPGGGVDEVEEVLLAAVGEDHARRLRLHRDPVVLGGGPRGDGPRTLRPIPPPPSPLSSRRARQVKLSDGAGICSHRGAQPSWFVEGSGLEVARAVHM